MAPTPDPAAVDAYVEAQTGEARRFLEALRELLVDVAPATQEAISYDMPAALLHGKAYLYYAAWKKHLGLYGVPVLEPDLEDELAPLRAAKGTIQLPYRSPFPSDLLRRLAVRLVERAAAG
jgi:uncharacterized protein YdhG (YjbR/CyaY superfamily)